MSKLFDLMVMVVKYQCLHCNEASCILNVRSPTTGVEFYSLLGDVKTSGRGGCTC